MAPEPIYYLSPQAVGELIGISGDTIRRLIKQKQLKAIRMPPGNYYKILPTEVLAYVETHNIPLSEANRRLLKTLSAAGNGEAVPT
jgi:excisionase family DNA binding protein